jgi:uncharacterized Tic20 family protein
MPGEIFPTTPDDRQWAMFAHLAGLLASSLTGMGFLGPLIIWMMKKEQSRFVDDQGKEALNFQLNLLGQAFILIFVMILLGFATFGLAFFVLIPLFMAWGVYAMIMPILGAVAANSGKVYRYPATIRVVT